VRRESVLSPGSTTSICAVDLLDNESYNKLYGSTVQLLCCGFAVDFRFVVHGLVVQRVVEQIHSTNRCKWSLGVTPRRSMSLIDLSPIDASSLDVFTAAAAAAAWGDRNVA